jgi:Domain of unknown function (DUF6456)
MDKADNARLALKTEIAAVIDYLSLGAADIKIENHSTCILVRNTAKPLQISVKALAYLARKNWVKRKGNSLSIMANAPGTNIDQTLPRAIEPFELVENGETQTVMRVAVESPLDYLASRKDKNGVPMIGQAEWSAGDRLRSDFTRANMLPSIGMRWGEPIGSKGGGGVGLNQTEAAMAARDRVTKALAAVGPEFSGLLLDVCCFLKGLEQVEMERHWPQRSAKVMVRAGLSILARHYMPPTKNTAHLTSWGTDDFRPTL